MNEKEIRAEIKRRKDILRRAQAALPFAEKVRIAFEMDKRHNAFKAAKLIRRESALAPSSLKSS